MDETREVGIEARFDGGNFHVEVSYNWLPVHRLELCVPECDVTTSHPSFCLASKNKRYKQNRGKHLLRL
jgi:hypothetical protein